jgi:hypothetical protein
VFAYADWTGMRPVAQAHRMQRLHHPH